MLINTILFGLLPFLTYLISKNIPNSNIPSGFRRMLYDKTGRRRESAPIFLVTFIIIFFGFPYLNYIFLIFMFVFPFFIMGMSRNIFSLEKNKYELARIFLTSCILIFLIKINALQMQNLQNYNVDQKRLFVSFHVILFWGLNLESLSLFYKSDFTSDENLHKSPHLLLEALLIISFLILIIFIHVFSELGFHSQMGLLEATISFFSNSVHILNLYFLGFMLMCFWGLLGRGLGSLLSVITVTFLFFSNFLKLKYHDTFFSWFDLFQIREMLLMGREFLSGKLMVLVIILFIAFVFSLINSNFPHRLMR